MRRHSAASPPPRCDRASGHSLGTRATGRGHGERDRPWLRAARGARPPAGTAGDSFRAPSAHDPDARHERVQAYLNVAAHPGGAAPATTRPIALVPGSATRPDVRDLHATAGLTSRPPHRKELRALASNRRIMTVAAEGVD